MYDIPAQDDPRIQITISVPIKGRKPLTLKVPRYDFITEDIYDAMDTDITAIDEKLAPRKQIRLARLAMLKPFLSPAEYKACETLTVGQLDAVVEKWATESNIPLGEYLASVTSSETSTEAPSNTTSSSEDSPAETSDAA
jgi:hypothetical protein